MSIVAKDADNLITGVQTYGFWEYICLLDTTCYDLWIHCADGYGLGLGFGLIVSSLITRAIFSPFIIYG